MDEKTDEFGYGKMKADELRKVISDLVKSNIQVQQDKKDYVSGANEVIKETTAKIKAAVMALVVVEQTDKDAEHEKRTGEFLRSVPTGK